MPKLRDVKKPDYPPINWLLAAILERKKVMGLEWDDIAKKANMSSPTLRKMLSTTDPLEWDFHARKSICEMLGIEFRTKSYVVGSPEDPEAKPWE